MSEQARVEVIEVQVVADRSTKFQAMLVCGNQAFEYQQLLESEAEAVVFGDLLLAHMGDHDFTSTTWSDVSFMFDERTEQDYDGEEEFDAQEAFYASKW